MNDIVERCDDNNSNTISIGNNTAGSKISFQLAQDFYNEITGKSEEIEEDVELPIITTKNNIEQLNHRVQQTLEQYNVVSLNYSISVKYMNDSSERYSSIERFSLHAGNKGKPVENISLEYRVLIILPKVSRPQEYKITASISSREAAIEGLKDKFGKLKYGLPIRLFERSTTASFKIEFIDVSVARAIMTALTDWVKTLETTNMNKTLKIIRSKSSMFPIISKYAFLFVSFYFITQYASIYFINDINQLPKGFSFFIISAGVALFSIYRIGLSLGKFAEYNIDSLYESSYINLSQCDETLAENSKANMRLAIIKSVLSLSFTFLLSVAASLAASNLS